MPATRPLESRFSEKVCRLESGCWEWTGSTNRDGYGSIKRGRGAGTALAHRIAWELSVGPIKAGMEVCHRCDNTKCVNPQHLFVATHADNIRDCAVKGRLRGHRYASGINHRMAKLTDVQVRLIRVAVGTQADIGRAFGIGQAHVGRIKNRLRWRDVA